MSAVAAAAKQAVKRFRYREFEGALSHEKRFGQPPEITTPSTDWHPWRVPNPFVPWRHPENGKFYQLKYSLRHQVELVKKAKISGTLHLLPPGIKTPKYVVPPRVETPAPAPTPEVAETSAGATNSEESVVEKQMSKKKLLIKRLDKFFDRLSEAPFDWYVCQGREEREEARVKKVLEKPGAELGTRLYAGKKRMFKGHKWERVKAHRERRQNILMRDMKKRVYNYKNEAAHYQGTQVTILIVHANQYICSLTHMCTERGFVQETILLIVFHHLFFFFSRSHEHGCQTDRIQTPRGWSARLPPIRLTSDELDTLGNSKPAAVRHPKYQVGSWMETCRSVFSLCVTSQW